MADETIDDLIAQFKDMDNISTGDDYIIESSEGISAIKNTWQPLFAIQYWKWTLFFSGILLLYVCILLLILRPDITKIKNENDEWIFSWKRYFITCLVVWIFLLISIYLAHYIYFATKWFKK